MAFEDMDHKSLKKLIQLCLLANLITLAVVVYGTFYQDTQQKMAMEKLQGSMVNFSVSQRAPLAVTPPHPTNVPTLEWEQMKLSAGNPANQQAPLAVTPPHPTNVPTLEWEQMKLRAGKICGDMKEIQDSVQSAAAIVNAKLDAYCNQ